MCGADILGRRDEIMKNDLFDTNNFANNYINYHMINDDEQHTPQPPKPPVNPSNLRLRFDPRALVWTIIIVTILTIIEKVLIGNG